MYLPIWCKEKQHFTSVMFFPKTHHRGLITRVLQTNPNEKHAIKPLRVKTMKSTKLLIDQRRHENEMQYDILDWILGQKKSVEN